MKNAAVLGEADALLSQRQTFTSTSHNNIPPAAESRSLQLLDVKVMFQVSVLLTGEIIRFEVLWVCARGGSRIAI